MEILSWYTHLYLYSRVDDIPFSAIGSVLFVVFRRNELL